MKRKTRRMTQAETLAAYQQHGLQNMTQHDVACINLPDGHRDAIRATCWADTGELISRPYSAPWCMSASF